MSLVWIHGAGEQASGIAWRLMREGYRVVMAEIPRPTTVRRLVSFSEAVYEGRTEVEGISALLCDQRHLLADIGTVTVVVDPDGACIEAVAPDVVVDARLTKRTPVPLPHGSTPLIGIGPGFLVGRDADLVIETHRTAGPGRVIRSGGALPYTGIPGKIGGETLRRVLRAPCAGFLTPCCQLGDLIAENQIMARIDGQTLHSAIAGRVRGLIHSEVELCVGMKVGDVDPRGEAVDPHRISDKALAIGGGVLAALQMLNVDPVKRGAD